MSQDSTGKAATAADDPSTEAKCVKMEAFLEMHGWRRPQRRNTDPEERNLRKMWDELLRRCSGPIGQGIHPKEHKLTTQARARVGRIEQEIERRQQSRSESATGAALRGESKSADADQVVAGGTTRARKHSPPQREASADWRSKRPRTTLSEDSAAPTSGSDIAATLCLRGLNIQWPFSQLILLGAKTEESDIYCKS